MQIIAIQNQKGGTGKSTTVVNLAATLAELSKRVLVIDFDQQRSTSNCFEGPDGDESGSFAVLGGGKAQDNIFETNVTGVDLMPGSISLAMADQAVLLDRRMSMSPNTILKSALGKLPKHPWDFVLIDCPPALGVLTKNALVCADAVLVPVETQFMPLEGVAELLKTVEAIREQLNPSLRLLGILACRHQSKALNEQVLKLLQTQFGAAMFKTVIRENVQVAEAPSFRMPVVAYAKRSPGAQDYRALAREVVARTASESRKVANA